MLHVTKRVTKVRPRDVMGLYHVIYETFALKCLFGSEL